LLALHHRLGMVLHVSIPLSCGNLIYTHTGHFPANQQAGSYFSPIVGCLLGEFIGRYMNDWIAARGIKR
jgi:hypothetical protein